MDKESFDEIYVYLSTKKLPESIHSKNRSTQFRFVKKTKDFNLKEKILFFQNRLVLKESQVNEFLTKVYKDPATGFIGMNRLYKKFNELTFGITEEQIKDFLRNLEVYQLHQPVIKERTVKPIISS